MDLLSIGIMTYNRKKRLNDLLKKIFKYNKDNWYVIVCDDCSTDGTSEVIKQFENEKRLIYIKNEHNLGYDGNQVRVMTEAKKYGQYSLLIGEDDTPEECFFSDIPYILKKHKPHLVLLETKDYIGGRLNRYLSNDIIENDFYSIVEKTLTMPFGSFVIDNSCLDFNYSSKYYGTTHTYLGLLAEALVRLTKDNIFPSVYTTSKPYVVWGKKSLEELETVYTYSVLMGFGKFFALLPEEIKKFAEKALLTYILADNPNGSNLRWRGYVEKKHENGEKILYNELPSLEYFLSRNNIWKYYDTDKFILYGAGDYGMRALKLFFGNMNKVKCFIDRDKEKQGNFIYGIKIENPAVLKQKGILEKIIVSVHPMTGGADIMQSLLDKGFIQGKDFVMIEEFRRELGRLIADILQKKGGI